MPALVCMGSSPALLFTKLHSLDCPNNLKPRGTIWSLDKSEDWWFCAMAEYTMILDRLLPTRMCTTSKDVEMLRLPLTLPQQRSCVLGAWYSRSNTSCALLKHDSCCHSVSDWMWVLIQSNKKQIIYIQHCIALRYITIHQGTLHACKHTCTQTCIYIYIYTNRQIGIYLYMNTFIYIYSFNSVLETSLLYPDLDDHHLTLCWNSELWQSYDARDTMRWTQLPTNPNGHELLNHYRTQFWGQTSFSCMIKEYIYEV